eukprot:ANDGO_07599.mRNA.1 hypothetical protein
MNQHVEAAPRTPVLNRKGNPSPSPNLTTVRSPLRAAQEQADLAEKSLARERRKLLEQMRLRALHDLQVLTDIEVLTKSSSSSAYVSGPGSGSRPASRSRMSVSSSRKSSVDDSAQNASIGEDETGALNWGSEEAERREKVRKLREESVARLKDQTDQELDVLDQMNREFDEQDHDHLRATLRPSSATTSRRYSDVQRRFDKPCEKMETQRKQSVERRRQMQHNETEQRRKEIEAKAEVGRRLAARPSSASKALKQAVPSRFMQVFEKQAQDKMAFLTPKEKIMLDRQERIDKINAMVSVNGSRSTSLVHSPDQLAGAQSQSQSPLNTSGPEGTLLRGMSSASITSAGSITHSSLMASIQLAVKRIDPKVQKEVPPSATASLAKFKSPAPAGSATKKPSSAVQASATRTSRPPPISGPLKVKRLDLTILDSPEKDGEQKNQHDVHSQHHRHPHAETQQQHIHGECQGDRPETQTASAVLGVPAADEVEEPNESMIAHDPSSFSHESSVLAVDASAVLDGPVDDYPNQSGSEVHTPATMPKSVSPNPQMKAEAVDEGIQVTQPSLSVSELMEEVREEHEREMLQHQNQKRVPGTPLRETRQFLKELYEQHAFLDRPANLNLDSPRTPSSIVVDPMETEIDRLIKEKKNSNAKFDQSQHSSSSTVAQPQPQSQGGASLHVNTSLDDAHLDVDALIQARKKQMQHSTTSNGSHVILPVTDQEKDDIDDVIQRMLQEKMREQQAARNA